MVRKYVSGVKRAEVLGAVANYLLTRSREHPLRVGVDGWCAAGKTTFRRELAEVLRLGDRPVVELDSDGFHQSRALRYRQGRESARGYYDDAYDFGALERLVLRPLGPGGDRRIAVKVHDLDTDRSEQVETDVDEDAIVLFDCTFLQRGALRRHWDEVIYLDVRHDVVQMRGVDRDADALGGHAAATVAYDNRYLAACQLYQAEEQPHRCASILVDNTELDSPVLVRMPG